jgi:histone acetyltransferase
MELKASEDLSFEVLRNDGSIASMKKLIDLKNIFARQLPKMPKEYIVRLIFDPKHESIVIKNEEDRIFGGVCYCIFSTVKLAEIVFLAIMSDRQIRGYGTKLMNYLKTEMQKQQISFLMTCADNLAIGYFKKQGFHKEILMPYELWKGYLKDYEGSTLMECLIDPDIDYINIGAFISNQKITLIDFIKTKIENNTLYKGFSEIDWKEASSSKQQNKYQTLINPEKIPGLKNSGFTIEEYHQILVLPKGTSFQSSCLKILDQLVANKASWPFLTPVKKEEVPDYYDVIKEPIDFQTLRERVNQGYYLNKKLFISDVKKIFNNARTYNVKNTIYYKYANELEAFSEEIFINLKDETTLEASRANEELEEESQTDPTKAKRVKSK